MNSYEVSSHAFSDTDFIILVGENFPNKQFIDCPLHIFLLKFSECHPDVRLMIAKQKFSQGTKISLAAVVSLTFRNPDPMFTPRS